MNAPDLTPTPPSLDAESVARLRAALAEFARDGNRTPSLRDALRRVADEARGRQIRAEQLLVLLKELWSELPDVRRAVDVKEKAMLLQRLVTWCIEEYYGPGGHA